MNADEILFALAHPAETRIALYMQLVGVEGRDPEIASELMLKLDTICGLRDILYRMPEKHSRVLHDTFFIMPGKKARQYAAEDQLKAIQALMQLVNGRNWDLSHYQAWRREKEGSDQAKAPSIWLA